MKKMSFSFIKRELSLSVILILIITCYATTLKSQDTTKSIFIKEFHNYKINDRIKVVVLYKKNFYCLKTDSQVFIINSKNNLIDDSYHDNSKAIGLQNLYLRNDTLVGESRWNTYFLKNNTAWVLLKKDLFREKPVFNDDKYYITSTCSGEWGGSLHFINKKTNKVYECSCTCTVNVIKNNGAYLATASLSHMAGFTNIFVVYNPLKLKPLNLNYLKKGTFIVQNGKKRRIGIIGEDESTSKQGTKQLIDSIGITIAASFIYNSAQYFITEKYRNVSIDIIQNNKLVPVENLTKLNIWSNYPENRSSGEAQVSTFANEQNTGFIFIDNNKLTFYNFKTQHN